MDVNDCYNLDDASDETMRVLSDLIEASRTDEHMVYREAEIDELWRLLRGNGADAETIAEIMVIHDLLEVPGNAVAAARRLRTLADGVGAAHA